jgi:hypothetical protein
VIRVSDVGLALPTVAGAVPLNQPVMLAAAG